MKITKCLAVAWLSCIPLIFISGPPVHGEPQGAYPEAVDVLIAQRRYADAELKLRGSQTTLDRKARLTMLTALKMLADRNLDPDRLATERPEVPWAGLASQLRRIAEGPGRDPHAMRRLGAVLWRTGDFAGAVRTMEEAGRLGDTEPGTTFCFIAWARFHAGDARGAFEAYEQARGLKALTAWAKRYGPLIAAETEHDKDAVEKQTEHFTILCPPRYAPILLPVMETRLEAAFGDLQRAIDWAPKGRIVVRVYDRPDQFAIATGLPSDIGADLIGGISRFGGNVIRFAVPAAVAGRDLPPDYFGVAWDWSLRYSLTHAFVRQYTLGNVPNWLAEGSAIYFQPRDSSRDRTNALAAAIRDKRFISAAAMDGSMEGDPFLMQAQSAAGVAYIVKKYGNRGYRDMLTAFADGSDPAEVFKSVLNLEPAKLYAAIISYASGLKLSIDTTDGMFEPGYPAGVTAVFDEASRRKITRPDEIMQLAGELIDKGEDPAVKYAVSCWLGNEYMRRGRMQEAAAVLEKALSFVKKPYGAGLMLGYIYRTGGDPQAAVKQLEKALAISPGHILIEAELGRANADLGNVDVAIRRLENAHDKAPYLPLVSQKLGELYMAKKDPKTARGYLEEQLGIYPYYPQTWQFLADCSPDWADRAKAALAALKDWPPKGEPGK